MRKEKVISNYKHLSDNELSILGSRVFKAMMEGNSIQTFPNLHPSLSTLEAVISDYVTKNEIASRGGSILQNSQKNESREAILGVLRSLAHYVNEVANGQLSLLLSTGLILVAQPTASLVPLVTDRIRLRDGRVSGHLHIDFSHVKGAWEYEIQVGDSTNEQGEIQWVTTLITTSSRGNILTGLNASIRYYVRLRARNGKGFGDWSEPVSLIAR